MACDGDVWVTVPAGYAEKHVPDPAPALLESLDEAGQKNVWARVYVRRDVFSRSVVPCKVCRPDLFFRWEGGHLDKNHNTHACDVCSPARVRRSPPPSQDRKDLE